MTHRSALKFASYIALLSTPTAALAEVPASAPQDAVDEVEVSQELDDSEVDFSLDFQANQSNLTVNAVATPSYSELVNVASDLRADVMWGSKEPTQGVFLWPNNDSASQEFTVISQPNGYFSLKARHSGQCLMPDWRGGTYTNGTRILQYPDCRPEYAPGQWKMEWVTTTPGGCTNGICGFSYGVQVLRNRASGLCLDAAYSPKAQTYLQLWSCITPSNHATSANQVWKLFTPGATPPPVH